jgi:hypothetical protein
MTRSGVAYELPTSALPTVGSVSSYLPTPQAHDAVGGKTPEQVEAMRRRTGAGVSNLNEVVFPTPRASDGEKGGPNQRGSKGDLTMNSAVQLLLKTPTSQLAVNGGSQHPDKRKEGGHGPTLADEVEHLLPTPTVQDAANTGGPSQFNRNTRPLNTEVLTLLPTPAANDSGNTPENHLRKKPGRQVVTSRMVMADYDLIRTGGHIVPPLSAGSES